MSAHPVAPDDRSLPLAERVRARRADILRLVTEAGASNARLFGSVARGTTGPASEVDQLIDLEERYSLFRYMRLNIDLEALLGCRVDLVTPDELPPRSRAEAEHEAVPV